MEQVIIMWKQVNIEEILYHEDVYFYAFGGEELLYIGIAFYQDVNDEIKQSLRSFNLDPYNTLIWIGFIEDKTFNRDTKQIIRDIECLLIYVNQPEFNTQCKENYTGRDNLMILSEGCLFLENCIKCEDNKIYKC